MNSKRIILWITSCTVIALLFAGAVTDLRGYASESEEDRDIKIEVWYGHDQYFGMMGQPQRWINILGNIHPAEIVDSAFFRLNGGAEQSLTLGSDLHRLALAGDFNTEISWNEVHEGLNNIEIIAKNKNGIKYYSTVRVHVHKGETWPLPYHIDFSKIENLQKVTQVVDGHWRQTGKGVRTVQRWYDRVLSMGDTTWKNYESTVRLTIHDYTISQPGPPTYNVTHMGIAMRWRGHHQDQLQPSRKWFPLGAQGEFLVKENHDSCQWRILYDGRTKLKPPTYSKSRNKLKLGQPIIIKTQVCTLPNNMTRYRFKQWMEGDPEPFDWDVAGTEADDYTSGALCLVPHNTDVTIHEVRVESLVIPEMDFAARPGPGTLHYTAPVGGMYGSRGQRFELDIISPETRHIAIQVNLGPEPQRIVRGIRFKVWQGNDEPQTFLIGHSAGQWQEWYEPTADQELIGISGASGWYIDAIQFHFDQGDSSIRYGGLGGDTVFNLSLIQPKVIYKGRVRGFHGTFTEEGIETIGLIFDPGE